MAWRAIGVTSMLLWGLCGWNALLKAQDSRFARTYSRSQYVHWIDLYDAAGNRIDPTAPDAAPYSPVHTCGKCHDYDAIAHGYHFNAMERLTKKGRPGEPWIWTDTRTGTQIPLSYRGWPGTYDPRSLGISAWDFVLQFGRQMPGGGPGAAGGPAAGEESEEVSARDAEQEATAPQTAVDEAGADPIPAAPVDNGRWNLSGRLAIDCMMCHSQQRAYSPEKWWDQVTKQNFAWAPAAALGIADIEGDVSKLEDPEPAPKTEAPNTEAPKTEAPKTEGDTADAETTQQAGPELPKTSYRPVQMDADKKIFFDVVRKPSNDACYYCHTTRTVGDGATPDWTHDEDVHLRAGMVCADCHRNGIEHHTVRGFEGEERTASESETILKSVATLSCRGCHMGEQADTDESPGGRLGAPKPLHKGLPPLHLERLSCTACHSGPRPGKQAWQVQTAMAHGLGLPTHHLDAATEPQMVAPVMLRTGEVLQPHRMVWPAFWGEMSGETVVPLNPEAVREAVRTKIRVRRTTTFTEVMGEVKLTSEDKVAVLGEERAKVTALELTEEEKAKLDAVSKSKALEGFREKLGEGLVEIKKIIKTPGAQPVYIAGGRGYRLGADEKVEEFANSVAQPYAWSIAHDVRPARWSSGASGCFECHTVGSPIFDGEVTAMGPAIDPEPPSDKMAELAGYDRTQIDAWNRSFQGRTAFKWFGFLSAGVVAVILLSFVSLGVNGVFGLFRRS